MRPLSLAVSALPLALVLALGTTTPAQSIQIKIDPQAAFLRTWSLDQPTLPNPLDLSALGSVQGKSLRIRGLGDFDNGPGGDEFNLLHAVFSASTDLLPQTEQFRVVDAIPAGKPTITGLTAFGNEPTDIPEDFMCTVGTSLPYVVVAVPAGANHLFIAVPDVYYVDNSDPDQDCYAEITVVGTWTDLGSALAGSAGEPQLSGEGFLLGNDPLSVTLEDARSDAPAWLVMGFSAVEAPFKGGVLVPSLDVLLGPVNTGPQGTVELNATWPTGVPSGATVWMQFWIQDDLGPAGVAASNGLSASAP